eukprot:1422942-Pyramimonas_sp.AAC.1
MGDGGKADMRNGRRGRPRQEAGHRGQKTLLILLLLFLVLLRNNQLHNMHTTLLSPLTLSAECPVLSAHRFYIQDCMLWFFPVFFNTVDSSIL